MSRMTNTPTPCPGEVMELAREAMLSYFRDHRTPVSVKMVAGYKNEPLEEAIARAIMADRARRSDPSLTAEIERLFKRGDRVTKIKGSSWTGLVVGFYSTSLTPVGYCVESENEPGSVQIYPESALRAALGEA